VWGLVGTSVILTRVVDGRDKVVMTERMGRGVGRSPLCYVTVRGAQ
jgi:hypothetical protein